MSIQGLIEEARSAGLQLYGIGDFLKLTGPENVVEQWKSRVVDRKQDILDVLNSDSGASWWMYDYPDSESTLLHADPPSSISKTELINRKCLEFALEPQTCSICHYFDKYEQCSHPEESWTNNCHGTNPGATCPSWWHWWDAIW
jgi:hypothetical protein